MRSPHLISPAVTPETASRIVHAVTSKPFSLIQHAKLSGGDICFIP